MWDYRAQLVRVLDGDTIAVLLDQGLSSRQEEHIRLVGAWAPEKGEPGYGEATQFTADWIMLLTQGIPTLRRWPMLVHTMPNTTVEPSEKRSLTRYLGIVYDITDPTKCLNVDLAKFLATHPEWGPGQT